MYLIYYPIHDACTLLSYINVTFTYTCVCYHWDTWEMMQATSDRKHKSFLYCCCYSLWRAQVFMGICEDSIKSSQRPAS